MTDPIKEQISALLDGELPVAERRLLLERLSREPALRGHWAHYQLISDALRHSLPERIDLGLAARVQAQLAAEPAHAPRARWPRLLKPLASLAVAASVAVVAVVAVQQGQAPQLSPRPQIASTQPADPLVMPGPEAFTRVQGTRWEVQQPQVRQRLNEYLVNHSEYATSSGVPGMHPYVRIVGYDQE